MKIKLTYARANFWALISGSWMTRSPLFRVLTIRPCWVSWSRITGKRFGLNRPWKVSSWNANKWDTYQLQRLEWEDQWQMVPCRFLAEELLVSPRLRAQCVQYRKSKRQGRWLWSDPIWHLLAIHYRHVSPNYHTLATPRPYPKIGTQYAKNVNNRVMADDAASPLFKAPGVSWDPLGVAPAPLPPALIAN